MTPLGAFLAKQRSWLAGAGARLFGASSYLRLGADRSELTGALADALDDLAAQPQHQSNRVALLGYSFGAILALDTLLPASGHGETTLQSVGALVTVAAPYDFVDAARRGYFDDRTVGPQEGQPRWQNIYSPVDLLGSNLRDDADDGRANAGIRSASTGASESTAVKPEINECYDTGIEPGWMNLLEFYGFLAHGTYWGPNDRPDRNMFRLTIDFLFPEKADVET